jgi:hypothetical protein
MIKNNDFIYLLYRVSDLHLVIISSKVELPAFTALERFVVGLLTFVEVLVFGPVTLVIVVRVNSISSVAYRWPGEQELLVHALIKQ